MANLTDEIFEGKTFADLLLDIYTNAKEKDKIINNLMTIINGVLEKQKDNMRITDLTVMMPMINELNATSIKNNDILVKLAAVVQRSLQKETTSSGIEDLLFSKDEMKELQGLADEEKTVEVKQLPEKVAKVVGKKNG